MNDEALTAPPVVAVVVAHDPGPWFEEVLDALADQDYPNLRVLVLDTGAGPELAARVGRHLPGAFIRRRTTDAGFGAQANDVLRLVEGGGFFCLLHDDVALDASAVRLLVEETYRSNAGIAGPKLVDWDDPRRLQSVGFGADKFGEIANPIEPGELDQEQHDAVRDVFCLSSACLLVRADLFRAIGGYDPDIDFFGDDLDLCWRAHLSGARVLVVPAARARHRASLAERRPDLDRESLVARHRLRSVLANYSAGHLLRVLPQYVILTVLEALGALVTGHAKRAGALVRAWTWNIARVGAAPAIRRRVRALRQVPDADLRRLQDRGSARMVAVLKGQGTRRRDERFASMASAGRDLVENLRTGTHRATIGVWGLLVVAFLVGSRGLLTGHVAAVDELLAFPAGSAHLITQYLSGWWPHGLGRGTATPTGVGLLGVAGTLLFGHMALLRTVLSAGGLLVGYLGMWRLTRPLAAQRARLTGLAVYAFVPLPYNALAAGRWTGVLAYAAMPWVMARIARLSGLAPYGPLEGDAGPGLPVRTRLAETVALGVITAVIGAFVPWFVLVVVATALALALGSLWAGGFVAALRSFGRTLAAAVIAVVLNLPWSAGFLHRGGLALGRTDPSQWPARPLSALLRFATGPHGGSALVYGIYLGVVVVLLAAQGWRWAWAARLVPVAVVSFAVAFLAQRGSLGVSVPAIEVLLAPAAVAVALMGACAGAAFGADVRGARFSWRQPASVLATAAVGVAALPMIVGLGDGRWKAPSADIATTLSALPGQQQPGHYRILWIGDPGAVPLPGWHLTDGLVYAVSRDGAPDVEDLWNDQPGRGGALIAQAVRLAADGSTDRLGRMLGPMGVRFVIVPNRVGPTAAKGASLPAPASIAASLSSQLDLREVTVGDDSVDVFENAAWVPVRAELSPGAAAASEQAGFDTLVRSDIAGSAPVLDSRRADRASGDVTPGVVYLAERGDSRWQLTVAGTAAKRRPGFGWANAFVVPNGGRASLTYATPIVRRLAVLVQALAWLVALLLASTRGPLRLPRRRAHVAPTPFEAPIIDLREVPSLHAVDLPWSGAVSDAGVEPGDLVPAGLVDRGPLDVEPVLADEAAPAVTVSGVAAQLDELDADLGLQWADPGEDAE